MNVIEVQGLRKTYHDVVAVDDISFTVEQGEIFGMVGPNGAGKTTTIECLQGLRKPDKGNVSVLGMDPQSDSGVMREHIGSQLQEAELSDRIRVWEAMDLYASFYENSVDWEMLLDRFELTGKRNSFFSKLSGGQKQRLFIALALINEPQLIFLDELTTGLDPQARRAMWDLVREVRDQGKTVVLTTHFMEEADQLCNRIAVVDNGRIIALDTPENLVRDLQSDDRIKFTVDKGVDCDFLADIHGVDKVEKENHRYTVSGQGELLVSEIVQALVQHKIPWQNLQTEHPTLEDVFLELTGREIRE